MTRPFDAEAAKGMLLGLAVGDALGTTLEFTERDSHPPVTGPVGGGPFNLEPGVWTDDTAMALCLADSLIEQRGWDAADCARRFLRWRDEGYMSPTGTCFDIGGTVNAALSRFAADGDPYAGSTDPDSSGNGGIMRLAPAVIAFHGSVRSAVDVSVLQSQITHASDECDDFAFALAAFLHSGELADALHRVPADTPRHSIKSSGYVRDSYEAAFWSFENTDCFRDCIVLAANLGGDADTVAAIAGQIAGRVYGMEGIPAAWLETLAWRDRIEDMAAALYEMGADAS